MLFPTYKCPFHVRLVERIVEAIFWDSACQVRGSSRPAFGDPKINLQPWYRLETHSRVTRERCTVMLPSFKGENSAHVQRWRHRHYLTCGFQAGRWSRGLRAGGRVCVETTNLRYAPRTWQHQSAGIIPADIRLSALAPWSDVYGGYMMTLLFFISRKKREWPDKKIRPFLFHIFEDPPLLITRNMSCILYVWRAW